MGWGEEALEGHGKKGRRWEGLRVTYRGSGEKGRMGRDKRELIEVNEEPLEQKIM